MKSRPQYLFRFRDEAQFQEVKDLVRNGLARSMNEFIMLAVERRLDDILGSPDGGGGND